MASPYGITNVPKLTIEAVQTVVPYKVTDQRRSCRVLAMDPIGSGIFRRCLHIVLYYKNVSEEDSGWIFAGWAKESLGKAISERPMLGGRLWRGKDDEHNSRFCPLFYVQVTNFQCGGYSIGISCSILLAELLVKEKFLNSWANIHNNILSSNNELKKPLFYVPHLKRNGSFPPGITSSTPRKDCVKTMRFKATAENANLDGETCKSLALHCVEETESRLGSKMDSEFYLFVKENCKDIIEIEKYSKHKHVKPQLSIKTQVTCAGWDEYLGAQEVAFREGNKPKNVSYWIGSVLDGLVMAIPNENEL
ncbi:hypothetical protein SO802_034308 [Lithocarpus litseifolius]|uniref:Uncharacterized protein n=1 Tax=Lithocarpus litseifolius TaxID=425828 RepID=A0AAW2BH72_9ROSI